VSDALAIKPSMMVTQADNCFIGSLIEKSPAERYMEMGKAVEGCGAAAQQSGKATRGIFIAAREQWGHNMIGKRLRNKTLVLVSAPGDRRSSMQRKVRQQACKGTQLHQTIDRRARILDTHSVREKVQWLAMKEWLEDTETGWDECHKENALWVTSIMRMTVGERAEAR
jgi:hypothetical protein